MDEQLQLVVVIDEGRRAAVVSLQPNLNCRGLVVFPLSELSVASIALPSNFRRTVCHVIDGFAFLAGSAAAEPRNDGLRWQRVVDNGVQRQVLILRKALQ